MNEQQLKEIMWKAVDAYGAHLTIYAARNIINKAIELAKEESLFSSTETEEKERCGFWFREARCVRKPHTGIDHAYDEMGVMWDKNEPYGAVKQAYCCDRAVNHEGVCAWVKEGKIVTSEGPKKEMCLIVSKGLTCSLEIDHEGPCDFV